MKITQEHFSTMRTMTAKLDPVKVKEYYTECKKEPFPLSDIRIANDIWRLTPGSLRFTCDTLYDYCNDDHITTALIKLMNEIIKE